MRSVLLHKTGIPVRVPASDRYAVCKLVIATLRHRDRRGQIMRDSDIHEAGVLFEALASRRRQHDVLDAWMEAWGRGPKWQTALVHGRALLLPEHRHLLHDMMSKATSETGDHLEDIGFICTAPDIPYGRAR
ncbi:MAG TPA: GSU2403 family nucleotidyltransferase fold protein [Azospirillum sp.]|nr:GSU2403 family nucleotidyltransferase fold protein [Azospirillum sp.]